MYKPDQFVGMKHNPFACKPGERIWNKYPDLRQQVALCKVPDITNGEGLNILQPEEDDLDMLVRYVILMVDRHANPLSDIKDFDYRSKVVCDLIGLKRGEKTVWSFIESDHYFFRDVMFEYFRLINDKTYELWYSLSMAYSINMATLRAKVDANADVADKQKIKNSAMADLKQIQEIEMRLFNDDRIREIVTKESVATDRDAERRALDEFRY